MAVLAFFIISNFGAMDKKEAPTFPAQSVCDTCGDGIINICDVEECLGLGCVAKGPEISNLHATCVAGLAIGDEVCIDNFHVQDNPHVYTSDGSKMCQSGLARTVDYGLTNSPCGALGDTWKCIAEEEAEERGITSCKDWQKPFAEILDSTGLGESIDSCATKAYIIMGLVMLLAIAVI